MAHAVLAAVAVVAVRTVLLAIPMAQPRQQPGHAALAAGHAVPVVLAELALAAVRAVPVVLAELALAAVRAVLVVLAELVLAAVRAVPVVLAAVLLAILAAATDPAAPIRGLTVRKELNCFVEATIRFLLQLLLACLIAASALVGGYALAISLRQEPDQATAPVTMTPAPILAEPARLPHRPTFAPASARLFQQARDKKQHLSILIQGLPDNLIASTGIAILDAELDRTLEWLPLAGLKRSNNGTLEVTAEVFSQTSLHIALATNEATARRGYFCRLAIAKDHAKDSPIVLAATVQQVTVQLGKGESILAPDLRLRRLGDNLWRPLSMGARPTPDANGALTLTLGEGEYELAPWTGDSWQPLKITVPGPMQLETSLTAPRGGRP